MEVLRDLDLNVNLCKVFLLSAIISTLLLGVLVNFLEPYLPLFIIKIIRYGKFASNEPESRLVPELPKSYFRHFYILGGCICYPIFFYEATAVYIFDKQVSSWTTMLLDLTCGSNRIASVSATHVYIAILLLLLQTLRRFYETQFISVFSANAKINLGHYLLGMAYYPVVILLLLSEAPQFAKSGNEHNSLQFSDVGLVEAFAVILFSWAWYHQHLANVILADLRKNKKGQIVSQSYKIPDGDWFNYISSPHSTAEIILYTALTILLAKSISWWYIYVWVLVNQTETILLSHWWYDSHFKDFPKNRKALVPYIY